MSYQVLARKWRPRNFSTLVGQEHVVRALTHALSEQRLHHAYLFTGTRGVGKTTIARILAKSLNCETGITANPCGNCVSCQEIDGGRFVDLLEVDAATNTRVDEMRQLLENAVYAPTRGRFKVYVIDEVHMLSNSAFNAMLKTLEEPPEHVKFILATTDPQKIPVTVLSRCLQFNLKQMTTAAIAEHLAHILRAEDVPFESPALVLLAGSASGSMRDALSLLDQAIAHGAGKVEEAQVRSMLGSVDLDYLFSIIEALRDNDVSQLLQVAADIGMRSLSYAAALQELGLLLTRLQIAQCSPGALDDGDPESVRIMALSNAFSPEFVHLAYQITNHGRNELAIAPDEYAGFVMTLLRLFAFKPTTVAEVITGASSRKPAGLAGRAAVVDSHSAPEALPSLPDVARDTRGESRWQQIVSALPLSGLVRTLALNCELRQLGDNECLLRLAPEHAHLQMKPAPERLQQALSEHFGRPLAVKIELAQNEVDTPAATADRSRQIRQEQAIAAIRQDTFVCDMIESFGASIDERSIKPIA